MKRGNVLVIGNTGVGKSTLINAVLGENRARTGWGPKGTTNRLAIYESEDLPFRIIDTIGFDTSHRKERRAITAVKSWSKERAKNNDADNDINVIWFCVDGTSRKYLAKSIDTMIKATSMWKTVPIIAVITKSYSVPERMENAEMVYTAFEKRKRGKNVKRVIPVVAKEYQLDETTFAAPEGITELIEATNRVMPEGLKAGQDDVARFKLNRKRAMAHGLVGTSTTTAAVVGAIPIPLADAAILTPVEIAEINAIARIYGIRKSDRSANFMNTIIEVGTISTVAKAAISTIKAIPGVNIAASVLNAVIAGSIVAALGEGAIYAFEQVYLGKKSLDDTDWVRKMMEGRFSSDFIDRVNLVVKSLPKNASKTEIARSIVRLFGNTMKSTKKVEDAAEEKAE
ncbi:MAG: 50S ribosome-binding GTPase [Firmicutes bacterium]|nr:50S ribosome-binding GTPase [Bacillota bacterium]